MNKMNKWICKKFGDIGWIFSLFKCEKYKVNITLCEETNEVATDICTDVYYDKLWAWEISAYCSEHNSDNYKMVYVCAATLLIPNDPYCPSGISRWFRKNHVPTETCNIHKKPQPEFSKLDPDIRWHALQERFGRPVGVAPYFLISEAAQAREGTPGKNPEYTREVKEKIAEKATVEIGGHGNFGRTLADGGYYEKGTVSILGDLWRKDADGKFMTAEKQVNEDWIDEMLFALDTWIKREWFMFVSISANNSTINGIGESDWYFHPANGKNNTGFYVPELNQVYPTQKDVRSWQGHWYEWDHFGPMWKKEIASRDYPPDVWDKMTEEEKLQASAYVIEDDMTIDDFDDMNRNRATRELFKFQTRKLAMILNGEFGKMWGINHNEWSSGSDWHVDIMAPFYESIGIGKNRRLVSLLYKDWYKMKAGIWNHYLGSLDGCYYIEDCQGTDVEGKTVILNGIRPESKLLPDSIKFGFSQDGFSWGKFGFASRNYEKLRDAVLYSLDIGLIYECNNDFWFIEGEEELGKMLDFEVGITCGQALRFWLSVNG